MRRKDDGRMRLRPYLRARIFPRIHIRKGRVIQTSGYSQNRNRERNFLRSILRADWRMQTSECLESLASRAVGKKWVLSTKISFCRLSRPRTAATDWRCSRNAWSRWLTAVPPNEKKANVSNTYRNFTFLRCALKNKSESEAIAYRSSNPPRFRTILVLNSSP